MVKKIKDMSLTEIEIEINMARTKIEKMSEIEYLVLNLKKTQLNDLIGKIDEINKAICDLLNDKPATELDSGNGSITTKQTSRMSKIKYSILELLQNENITTNNIHQKLSERGIVIPFGNEKSSNEYSLVRASLRSLEKKHKVKRVLDKKGGEWELIKDQQ